MKRILFSLTIIFAIALSFIGFANSARGQDVERPTVLSAVFDNGSTEVIVTYSEPMHLGAALEPANYFVMEPSGNYLIPFFVTQEDAAGVQYRLTLEFAAGPGSTLTVNFVPDLAGNPIDPDPTTILIQGPPDTTPPTLVSAQFVNLNTAVIATFSEVMQPGQATEPANYFITEPSGMLLIATSITQHDLAGTQYRLNLSAAASSGSELTVLEISDLAMNYIDPNPTTIPIQDSGDAIAPVALSAVLDPTSPTSNMIVLITFSEPMNPGQVFNPATYLVTGPAGDVRPISAITQVDAAGMQFQLHVSGGVTAGSHVAIFDITDYALNVIVPNPTTLLISGFPDTTPPTVSATVATSLLAPPNRKVVNVGLNIADVTANPIIAVQVLSDEALSAGDVSYSNGVLSLRATRDNAGDGRVYVIVVTAADEAGNVASTCTTVVVPYSNSPADIASVQAQAAAACP